MGAVFSLPKWTGIEGRIRDRVRHRTFCSGRVYRVGDAASKACREGRQLCAL